MSKRQIRLYPHNYWSIENQIEKMRKKKLPQREMNVKMNKIKLKEKLKIIILN